MKRPYIRAPPNKSIQDVPDATQPFQTFSPCISTQSFQTSSLGQLNSQQQPLHGKSDKYKVGSSVFGFIMKKFITDNGSNSSSQKIGNAENKLNSNTASMPRSQSSNVSTDTSNVTKADCSELVLNGSTNYNLHSKSFVNNNDAVTVYSKSEKSSTTSSSGAAAKSIKPSSPSGPSPEHNNCL